MIVLNETVKMEDDIDLEKYSTVKVDYVSRAKFMPLRLNEEERALLKLLLATLNVSEYTDKVDIIAWSGKAKRIMQQLVEICSLMCGLMLAKNYKAGQKLVVDKEFKDNEEFFQGIFGECF